MGSSWPDTQKAQTLEGFGLAGGEENCWKYFHHFVSWSEMCRVQIKEPFNFCILKQAAELDQKEGFMV